MLRGSKMSFKYALNEALQIASQCQNNTHHVKFQYQKNHLEV